ncbi:speckle-type POZ protein-like isoform X1 [Sigmodon hispidus]
MFILQDFLLCNVHWLLPDDKLTLFCKEGVVQDFFSSSELNRKPGIQVSRCTLVGDPGELWENSRFTDCSLVVAGKEFWAPKAILAAHSPVFRAVVEHDMEESRRNHVEIHDLEPQVFKAMMDSFTPVRHQTSTAWQDAVLAAADKYSLEHLKVMCEDALFRDPSVENAGHTVFLADLHSTGQLKA